MVVLGLADSQDSGAALFIDGRIVAAVNEERLNRVKLWGGFPADSIREVLRLGGVEPDDVDTVVVGTRITPNILARAMRGIHQDLRRQSGQFGYLLNLFLMYQVAARKARLVERAEAFAARRIFARDLAKLGIRTKVVSIDHHLAHAWSAWATCPFDRALVVTLDGLGDGLGVTVSVGERGRGLRRVHEETGFSAITLYYSRLTEFLGFTPIRDEGKVNALAAYTDRTPALEIARQVLHHDGGRFNFQNHLLPQRKDRWPFSELARYSREEVAASFQRNIEDAVRGFLRHWLARTRTENVAVAGGAFANVKLNQRIIEMDEVRELYVFPHMGDGGLAVGGCYAYLGPDPEPLPDVFLGPAPSDAEVRRVLEDAGLPHQPASDPAGDIARLLASGKTVACVQGPMEYGPRALGNRSILAPATDPRLCQRLNERLRRNPVMPFAPSVLEDEYDACFVRGGKAAFAAQFMTVSFDATARMRDLCPAAVHVDGTARPQLVRARSCPALAAILREYRRLTGQPAVINTSFNMHEEPIVNTPAEAVRAFLQSGIDFLALGNYLVEQPVRESAISRGLRTAGGTAS